MSAEKMGKKRGRRGTGRGKTESDKKKRASGGEEGGSGQEERWGFLQGVRAYILHAGIQKVRMQIFKTQLVKFGGTVDDGVTDSTTHLVVDDEMDGTRLCKIMKFDSPPENVCVVKSRWLSSCFREKRLSPVAEYVLDVSSRDGDAAQPPAAVPTQGGGSARDSQSSRTEQSQCPKVGVMWRAFHAHTAGTGPDAEAEEEEMAQVDSDYSPDDDEQSGIAQGEGCQPVSGPNPGRNLPKGNWICSQSSKSANPNYNYHITEKLEEMVKNYQSTNDKWRVFGYQKAIQILKKQPKEITSWEEAHSLPGIGTRLADKIWEINESGSLQKLTEFKSNEHMQALNLFTDVWGAGPHTARIWYQLGFRTLEDLKTKANLTHQQKIGLNHYDDFLDRMSREEAAEIGKTVQDTALSIQPGVITTMCGSYRRGKLTCGDVDVLVTHPDPKLHQLIFNKLLVKLKKQGFLTDDLVSAEEDGTHKKYMGVCKLPGENRKYRRLDIITAPYSEYACALVHFTGSAHFNRSIRHLAKKMGMSLTEHSLNSSVVRKDGEKIYEGIPLPTPTEESIFKHVGVPYRPPEERDH